MGKNGFPSRAFGSSLSLLHKRNPPIWRNPEPVAYSFSRLSLSSSLSFGRLKKIPSSRRLLISRFRQSRRLSEEVLPPIRRCRRPATASVRRRKRSCCLRRVRLLLFAAVAVCTEPSAAVRRCSFGGRAAPKHHRSPRLAPKQHRTAPKQHRKISPFFTNYVLSAFSINLPWVFDCELLRMLFDW